jgi:hypothetical protein
MAGLGIVIASSMSESAKFHNTRNFDRFSYGAAVLVGSRCHPTAAARVRACTGHVGFVVGKVALG